MLENYQIKIDRIEASGDGSVFPLADSPLSQAPQNLERFTFSMHCNCMLMLVVQYTRHQKLDSAAKSNQTHTCMRFPYAADANRIYILCSFFPNIHDSSWQRSPQNACCRTWKCMDLKISQVESSDAYMCKLLLYMYNRLLMCILCMYHYTKNLYILRGAPSILYLCNLGTTSFYSRCTACTATIWSGIL